MSEEKITTDEQKEYKKVLDDVRQIAEDIKADAVDKGSVEKMESRLEELDEKNNVLAGEMAKAEGQKQEIAEMKTTIEGLEKKLHRLPAGSPEKEAAVAELKAFDNFLRKGQGKMTADEAKYLREDNDVEGGYLAPEEPVQEIIKEITEISPVRQVARVFTTSRRAITLPKRTAKARGGWRGEGEEMDQSQSSYGMIRIPLQDLDVYTIATNEVLSDAAFNLEAEIRNDIIEDFAQLEGAAFLTGDSGSNEPEGMLENTDVQTVTSNVSNALDGDDFFDLQAELKSGYNGSFMMNRRTIAEARKLKDNDGQYLFAAGLNSGTPNTIAGDPILSMIDMEDVATGDSPVLYGDFFRGYYIVDGMQITFLRDPFSLATSGKVRFVASRRVGGKVALAEAIKKLTIQ